MFTSICGDITIRGSAPDIVRKYEGMAYGAERDGDIVQCHIFRQHAEHWKRVQDDNSTYGDTLQDCPRGTRLPGRRQKANLRQKAR